MKTGKTVILIILVGLLSVNLYGQRNNLEIGLSGSAGLSALRFTTAAGVKPSHSAGFAFGCDIAVLFTNQWSLRTGVNMASYNAFVFFDLQETRNLTATPLGELPANSRFYMIAEYNRYEEHHEALYLRFLLMIQYRIPIGTQQHFYVAAGIQTGILANSSYRLRSGDVVIKGYSDFTMQYYEELTVHGFDIYSNIRSTSKPNFGIALFGAFETGMIWNLNEGMALYTGIFIDYGINDIRRGNLTKEPIIHNENGSHTFNSILFSQNDGKPMTGKVQPIAIGLRLRLSMAFRN